ncbi:MAG TPA: DUF3786 domain-containing protein [Spirochaetota bacterium]|nr:DUF3786 domain-containing protein [Spirochaetota bacterium]HPC41924.1 DUF3786 domain-containing protein [Spirochaetota bacterium]HPL17348.1 DUF3786 domain-containing protein [Spirochaetota bacterium]HQF09634.1 DUF3786 domain-containing protein [Spirochaetota bacterium]HQH98296.1 DUF3786 domain-containing protein [Spirochaetota bacterium]
MTTENYHSLYKTDALPGKQNNYKTAYREAAAQLSPITIVEIARKSGAGIIENGPGKALILPFLGEEIQISHPEISVSYSGKKDEVPLWVKILTLHYLVRAGGTAQLGEDITFKQLEGGLGYYPAFERRCITPLLDAFGNDMERYMRTGTAAGGVPSPIGEHALAFGAFPRVEVTFILWKGDDEFPPAGSVVFDSSISDYLSTEDVAVLCNMIAVRILKTPLPR